VKALVIYESMFGNTEAVARAVAEGMSDRFDVVVADVRTMPRAFGMDLIVVGAPTHAFGMSRPATRADAVRQGADRENVAEVGLREWLDTSPQLARTAAAAFDTKIDNRMAGSAARKASRKLRRLGCRVIARPESYHVTGTPGPLMDGERERARQWGEKVAADAAAVLHHV
jgi:flavodoxin